MVNSEEQFRAVLKKSGYLIFEDSEWLGFPIERTMDAAMWRTHELVLSTQYNTDMYTFTVYDKDNRSRQVWLSFDHHGGVIRALSCMAQIAPLTGRKFVFKTTKARPGWMDHLSIGEIIDDAVVWDSTRW